MGLNKYILLSILVATTSFGEVCAHVKDSIVVTHKAEYDEFFIHFRANKSTPRFALKTNLLYLTALCLNVEGEYYFANRWSVNLEYQYAWWSNKTKHKYYRLAAVSPEVRYWFSSKRNFTGHFAGIYVGAGIYEFMAKPTNGIQGEFFIAGGVSYGYAFPVTKHMNIELSVGVGYMMTDYRKYFHHVDCYVYSETKKFTYFGPTKAKVSLVFPLQLKKR